MKVISNINPDISIKKKKRKIIGKKYGRKHSELSLKELINLNSFGKKKSNNTNEKNDSLQLKPLLSSRFLDPISYHNIFGVVLFDKINTKACYETDFAASANLWGTISGVGYDKENKVFALIMNPRELVCTPWRLLHTRLLSLGEADAKSFANFLENYCLHFEAVNFKKDDSKKEEILISPNEDSYSKIKNFLEEFSNLGYYAFVRKGKSLNMSKMGMVEILFNQNLLKFLNVNNQEFVYNCLRKGFPEFIRPESYFGFWGSLINSLVGAFIPYDVKLKTSHGTYRYARLRKPEKKCFFSNGSYYLVYVVSFDLLPLPEVKDIPMEVEFAKHRKEIKVDEYFNGNMTFFDQFYPSFSQNLRKELKLGNF